MYPLLKDERVKVPESPFVPGPPGRKALALEAVTLRLQLQGPAGPIISRDMKHDP
jgi:hypothetical protein